MPIISTFFTKFTKTSVHKFYSDFTRVILLLPKTALKHISFGPLLDIGLVPVRRLKRAGRTELLSPCETVKLRC